MLNYGLIHLIRNSFCARAGVVTMSQLLGGIGRLVCCCTNNLPRLLPRLQLPQVYQGNSTVIVCECDLWWNRFANNIEQYATAILVNSLKYNVITLTININFKKYTVSVKLSHILNNCPFSVPAVSLGFHCLIFIKESTFPDCKIHLSVCLQYQPMGNPENHTSTLVTSTVVPLLVISPVGTLFKFVFVWL